MGGVCKRAFVFSVHGNLQGPSGVQISIQNMHGTLDPKNNLTSVHQEERRKRKRANTVSGDFVDSNCDILFLGLGGGPQNCPSPRPPSCLARSGFAKVALSRGSSDVGSPKVNFRVISLPSKTNESS